MGFEVAGQIRFAQMMNNFWERRAKKKLEEHLEALNQILEHDCCFGYLVKTDRVGYLRALSKTKYVFRGLNKDDLTEGMLQYNKGNYDDKINPDFIQTLEDFYYGEIRKKANIVDLKLHRYNALRDEKLAICRENPNVVTEEYAQNEFSTTRSEMLEMVKKNELVFALGLKSNLWNILSMETYKKWLEVGYTKEDYPIELIS